jgi:pimeloyl-ACP methyl ester carboxylesterase
MPAAQVSGQTIFYETLGHGQPLLLMHGWMQIGQDLIRLAEGLAIQYRVVLPDLPGYGRSVPPYRSFPTDFYHRDARLMCGFLDALGLSNVHIVGFSDGGEMALLMPIQRPDLCRSVIAWGAVGAFDTALCDHVRRGLPPTWITDAHRAKHPGQDVDQWPYQWADAFCAIVAAGGAVSLSRAAEIKCPLLLMLGDQDRLNPIADGQRFIEAASRDGSAVRIFEVFKWAGHALQDEQPERFLTRVRNFLQECP